MIETGIDGTAEIKPLRLPTEGRVYRHGKRCLDLLISVSSLWCVLPLGLAIGFLIKCASPGPALYRQIRIGMGGKPFYLWKFRTMLHDSDHLLMRHLAVNAEARQEWSSLRKLKRDPRVTRVGRFLRRTSLDELPQILNVLLGEMSLVGPRPIVSEEVRRYGPGATLYTAVLPGITGMWQVSGRSSIPFERRIALDVEYVSSWSVARDLRVMMMTFAAVWTGRGAF